MPDSGGQGAGSAVVGVGEIRDKDGRLTISGVNVQSGQVSGPLMGNHVPAYIIFSGDLDTMIEQTKHVLAQAEEAPRTGVASVGSADAGGPQPSASFVAAPVTTPTIKAGYSTAAKGGWNRHNRSPAAERTPSAARKVALGSSRGYISRAEEATSKKRNISRDIGTSRGEARLTTIEEAPTEAQIPESARILSSALLTSLTNHSTHGETLAHSQNWKSSCEGALMGKTGHWGAAGTREQVPQVQPTEGWAVLALPVPPAPSGPRRLRQVVT